MLDFSPLGRGASCGGLNLPIVKFGAQISIWINYVEYSSN